MKSNRQISFYQLQKDWLADVEKNANRLLRSGDSPHELPEAIAIATDDFIDSLDESDEITKNLKLFSCVMHDVSKCFDINWTVGSNALRDATITYLIQRLENLRNE